MRSLTDSLSGDRLSRCNRCALARSTSARNGWLRGCGHLNSCRRGRLARRKIGTTLVHEPDYVSQRRIVAQLAVLIARDVVDLADGGEHFRLLDGVNAEIGFEIQIQVQHVSGIAGLLDCQVQNAFFHRIASARLAQRSPQVRCSRVCWSSSPPSLPRRVAPSTTASGRRSFTKRITWASVG